MYSRSLQNLREIGKGKRGSYIVLVLSQSDCCRVEVCAASSNQNRYQQCRGSLITHVLEMWHSSGAHVFTGGTEKCAKTAHFLNEISKEKYFQLGKMHLYGENSIQF